MTYNIINIILLIVITIVQIFLPIAEDRTYFTYIVPILTIIFRIMFVCRTFGVPIKVKIPPIGEIVVYLLTMFFFFSSYYKKRFELNYTGIIINVILILVILISEFVESQLFIYEYREIEDEDKEQE